ncbi:MAG TPA: LON peptidase substrate-binding domain-containing protein, partial [Nitrospirales bacterium]|nr:LON peptidase substrate-binding domain-containing protein [Nitrospirales bacterium]
MSSDFPSAESDTFPIPDIVPIFPLPTTVFFPETYLPLHIFEPRYREMVRQTSAQGDCIGMALLKEGWEDEYEESPPIYPIGCVGRIISSHKLPDGRFNIVLQGLQRCTFEEQEVSTPYRQAQIIPYAQRGAASLDIETRINLEQVTQEYLTWKKAHELCQVIASGKLTDSIL